MDDVLLIGMNEEDIIVVKNFLHSQFTIKDLGYTTIACHPQSGHNYKRNVAWKNLGFDKTYFEEDFKDLDYWANRTSFPTDESVYNNVIRWLDENDDNSPVFCFCITMQNHPTYGENTNDQNFVKTNSSWKKDRIRHEVEEYLSSLSLSDEAWGNLIEYYRDYKKDIIIAMCGDHGPYFDLGNPYEDVNDYYLNILSTPFVIWSNNTDLYNNANFSASKIKRRKQDEPYLFCSDHY